MEKPNLRKRIEPILRDIRPIQRAVTEEKSKREEKEPSPKLPRKPGRELRFPKRLAKPLFILALAALILIVSVSSARLLVKSESGKASFGELRDLVGALIAINSDINKLTADGFNFVFNGKGEELIALLKNLRANVSKLDALGVGLIDESTLGTASGGLEALIALLDKPGEQHLLILFLNPSEMRPIGGFAGSYGDVTLERGSIKNIEVNDIYYPDHFLSKKITPPTQLQTVTVDWGARDAAWFFDFPTSARKTAEFIEASQIYAKDGVRFNGAIAINVKVIEDILELTGPIELPEYGLTLTKDNFLEEVQREVEEGRDKQAGENPKRVLGVLAPVLIERLHQLNSPSKNTLALALFGRVTNKDIQFYFDDPKVEDFVRKVNWAGEVASLPENAGGDYLAVVNINIAGGKTDARIKQSIRLKSEIDSTGQVNNYLAVTRRHLGQDDEASWYRAKNQNFSKIFTVPEAELLSLTGATSKNINPQIDYESAGYSRDPLLESLERTRKNVSRYSAETYLESGKNVFAAWFSTPAGESKILEINYKGTRLSLTDGMKYRFIFDKQSGTESKFEYEITAPPGYKWAESNGSTFARKSDTIPARLELELTLVRN
ncbi:MAG: DUF4012 domain-containing protein [bacterium]|nr:DUF4012 domain-containing protein [bacterium]